MSTLQKQPKSTPPDSAGRITAKSYIGALLQRLVTDRLLVSIQLSGETKVFTSTVLKVFAQEEQFALDAIFPKPEKGLLRLGNTLKLSARFDGATLDFQTSLKGTAGDGGMPMYLVAMPSEVHYQQPREEHRVEVQSMQLPVVATLEGEWIQEGILADLSATGLSLVLPAGLSLKPDQLLQCTIRHDRGMELEVTVSVCRVLPVGTDGSLRVGGRLHQMPRHNQSQWERLVFELERRRLRPQPSRVSEAG